MATTESPTAQSGPSAYRKKPVVIQASQWFKHGDHPAVVLKSDPNRYSDEGIPWCPTLEGGHVVKPGDWIITGVKGEHYPCKPDIFAMTYEPATEPPAGARDAVGYVSADGSVVFYVDDFSYSRKPKAGTELFTALTGKADGGSILPDLHDTYRKAPQPAATGAGEEVDPVECETCGGIGTIDETLGGEYFSNPEAPCPDCDGKGEYTPTPTSDSLGYVVLDDDGYEWHADDPIESGHCQYPQEPVMRMTEDQFNRTFPDPTPAATGMGEDVTVPREIVANYARSTEIPRHRRICEAALAAQPAPGVGGDNRYAEQHARDSKELRKLCESRDFYKRRCEALQAFQSNMRDPERKAVCDILANGTTTALSTRPAESVAQGGDDGEYSQGIMGDGAAILHNGVPMTIDAIVATLNRTTPATGNSSPEFQEMADRANRVGKYGRCAKCGGVKGTTTLLCDECTATGSGDGVG